ncbi:hypothetical protein ACIBI3_40540 [Actinomadura luteofluorescens]|uniref:hypothetical protein n=1 Tax=Actinomadura luteofluorescens TaxID=46163 RepID=UPI00347D1C92
MPALHDLLQRFRPAGAPGPAAAVPSEHRAVEDELEPVFARLEGAEQERRRTVAAAHDLARSLTGSARDRAAGLIEQARAAATAERAAAAAEMLRAAEDEEQAMRAAAEDEARRVREAASTRMDGLVARAMGVVAGLLDETRASP